jgi:hypothetical protein
MSSLVPPLPTSGRPLPTKVVIRLLPPNLPEQELWDAIPEEFEVDYKKFVSGKSDNSTCYLNFKSFTNASDFIQKFHGRAFKDGEEIYRCVAAIAPYQRVPRAWKQLKNGLENEYLSEPHYQEFLESSQDSGGPVAPYDFSKEKSDTFVSPLVKSLAEQSKKINNLVKAKREERSLLVRKKKQDKLVEEEVPPVALRPPAKVKRKPKPAPQFDADKIVEKPKTRLVGVPLIIARDKSSEEKPAVDHSINLAKSEAPSSRGPAKSKGKGRDKILDNSRTVASDSVRETPPQKKEGQSRSKVRKKGSGKPLSSPPETQNIVTDSWY